AGASCGGGNFCNGAGACIGCLAASDCAGVDTECSVRTCTNGACGTNFAPRGILTAAQVAGDCRANICDGSGSIVTVNDDSDVQSDGNACTADTCVAGVASFPNAPTGTPCKQTGGNASDGAGNVDTSTAWNAFTSNNVRGAVSDDTGQLLWASGASGGILFSSLGGTTPTTISSNLANVRTVQIFEGQMYGSASSGNFNN